MAFYIEYFVHILYHRHDCETEKYDNCIWNEEEVEKLFVYRMNMRDNFAIIRQLARCIPRCSVI